MFRADAKCLHIQISASEFIRRWSVNTLYMRMYWLGLSRCFFRLQHLQRIAVVSSVNLLFEYFKLLSIEIVLALSPGWTTFFILQSPVACKYWR